MTKTLSTFSRVTSLLKPLIEPVDSKQSDQNFVEMFNDDFAAIGWQLKKEVEEDTGFEIVERVRISKMQRYIFCCIQISVYHLSFQREKLPERQNVSRSQPLSQQVWQSHLDGEGRVCNKPQLMEAIFKGVRRMAKIIGNW